MARTSDWQGLLSGDNGEGVATAFAQSESTALVRPKYVRREEMFSGDFAAGEGGEGGEGQELGVWIRVGVAISRLLEGKGALCALCRRCRKNKKGKVCELAPNTC